MYLFLLFLIHQDDFKVKSASPSVSIQNDWSSTGKALQSPEANCTEIFVRTHQIHLPATSWRISKAGVTLAEVLLQSGRKTEAFALLAEHADRLGQCCGPDTPGSRRIQQLTLK